MHFHRAALVSLALVVGVTTQTLAQSSFEATPSQKLVGQVQIPASRLSRPEDPQAEIQRLRAVHAAAFAHPRFGGKARRGFIVKELGGSFELSHNANLAFQPASTMKVVPYAIAIDYATRGVWQDLDTEAVTWVGAAPGTNRADEPCDLFLKQFAGVSKVSRSAVLSDALPTMIYNSDNPIHEALMRKIGHVAVNKWLRQKGLHNTQQFYGCQYPHTTDWWRYNRSTLNDLAKLYTLGFSGSIFINQTARNAFVDNLILNDAHGSTSYRSPIRGGHWRPYTKFLDRAVEIEAALLGKSRFVKEFLALTSWRSKGGAGGTGDHDYTESGFGVMSVPHRNNGEIEMKHYAMGVFTDTLDLPEDCDDDAACKADRKASSRVQNLMIRRELPIEPIRRALMTWKLEVASEGVLKSRIPTRIKLP